MTSVAERLSLALRDRYIIERELGAGGMATVYLARDLKHDRPVALKVLRPELAAALGGARFLLEVKITAGLNHPHILPLLDSGEVDDLLYYAMPFVTGETLRDRLARDKQLPIEDALRIAREVADALDYAHAHGVIHRDIKPENILLQSGYAVVADFGIARAITAATVERQTATGVAVGTPTYMSPEQATASRDIDGRADQYSLGCVLYEMLAGQAPFTGPTVESIVRQHVMTPPQSVTNIRPAVPAHVAAALTRALAKTPADRFNTARQFAEALTGSELAPATESAAPRRRRNYLIGAAVGVALATVFLLSRRGRPGTPVSATLPRTSIAVLPFENLTGAGPQAYFAGALQDELITQLSKLAALRVISRTSTMGYAGNHTPLRQLATELQVGSVVEATLQTDAARLRVNVRLIDVATETDLWAQRYDRTLDDAFAIQSDIAQQIAEAVGAALTSSQRQGLAAAPTTNDEAYRLYLQGEEYMGRGGKMNWEIAEELYQRALALDPRFALAHVKLSLVNGFMYEVRYDLSPARLVRQREEAQAALRLAPDLPEGHFAMAFVHYVGPLDYHRALDEFRLARAGSPSDAGASTWIGFTARRLGNWNEALAAYERLKQLEPRSAAGWNIGGMTYDILHRYAEEIRADNQALSLAPDSYQAAIAKGWSYARWHGQLDTLRAVVSSVPMHASLGVLGSEAEQYVQLLLWERRGDSVLRALPALQVRVFESWRYFFPSALYAGWAHQLRGDGAAAHVAFESARLLLDSVIRARPDDWRVHAARGLTLAGLGRREEARREAAWLQQSVVYRDDALDGPLLGEERARILAGAGDVDGALEEIERLLSRPSWISANMLRLDPRWDPIREQPRFKALLAKYAG